MAFTLLKNGEYKADLTPQQRDKLFFVGNAKNPLIIGKKGEIMDNVDEDFYKLYDIYRYFKVGLIKINIDTDNAMLVLGIRALSEVDNG